MGDAEGEKLDLVEEARLQAGHDSYNEDGLVLETDPRHAELAVAELGLQVVRPQTCPGGRGVALEAGRGWTEGLPQFVRKVDPPCERWTRDQSLAVHPIS